MLFLDSKIGTNRQQPQKRNDLIFVRLWGACSEDKLFSGQKCNLKAGANLGGTIFINPNRCTELQGLTNRNNAPQVVNRCSAMLDSLVSVYLHTHAHTCSSNTLHLCNDLLFSCKHDPLPFLQQKVSFLFLSFYSKQQHFVLVRKRG